MVTETAMLYVVLEGNKDDENFIMIEVYSMRKGKLNKKTFDSYL